MRVECKVSPMEDGRWIAIPTDGHVWGYEPSQHKYIADTADQALMMLRVGLESYERNLNKQRALNEQTITSIIDIDV